MFRSALLALTVVILGATAAAAAEPVYPKHFPKKLTPQMVKPVAPKIDPVWMQKQAQMNAPVQAVLPKDYSAEFAAIRRQTLEEKAAMMNTVPGALTAPVRLSVRSPYVDDHTWMLVASRSGVLEVVPTMDQVQMRALSEPAYTRPTITLFFRADPTRRYHVECSVASWVTDPQSITASDGRVTYSVNTTSRATLVFVLEPRAANDSSVQIEIVGEKVWAFRGCDITSAPV
jgi:hypothetical protein